ncbi:RING zinc finger-containing protein [Cavenderia fasciculata]|uniref:RING zinc finger-containing protein n=1 Tax=Cavenderia fasciculata TaxID=261658 RepID=F4PKW5_CACFS|nr:RING zinc finger-containing protein [Cavenderia fasciculata]EGG23187.1 RING zinc finger-containing protein [Cavenderia fasciculata]|eukprot:XP_004361038.1 RING zinc finger-containing protein [Cavenderia fasciculata]
MATKVNNISNNNPTTLVDSSTNHLLSFIGQDDYSRYTFEFGISEYFLPKYIKHAKQQQQQQVPTTTPSNNNNNNNNNKTKTKKKKNNNNLIHINFGQKNIDLPQFTNSMIEKNNNNNSDSDSDNTSKYKYDPNNNNNNNNIIINNNNETKIDISNLIDEFVHIDNIQQQQEKLVVVIEEESDSKYQERRRIERELEEYKQITLEQEEEENEEFYRWLDYAEEYEAKKVYGIKLESKLIGNGRLLRSSRKNKKERIHRSHQSAWDSTKVAMKLSVIASYTPLQQQQNKQVALTPASRQSTNNSSQSYETDLRRAMSLSTADYDREMRTRNSNTGLSQTQINDILNREITPEDYELLLMLDATVKPKTCPLDLVYSLPTIRFTADCQYPQCVVCLGEFELNETLTILPKCKHIFHTNCISNWLANASKNCPVDGLPCHE